MKTEDLKAQGLSDEQIAFVMAENGKDVKREKDKTDGLRSQLDTATATLKGFEGVDVAQLNAKISQLSADLAAKEADYNQKLAQRDFDDMISALAKEYKARDIQAVTPFLDVEKLKASKNQKEDAKAAFEAIKKEKAYLFEDDTAPRVVSFTNGPDKNTDNANTKANDALRALFRKE
ncbi:MAG: phage scaffolding protein [Oscillospiraceae bacterium]|nr:phage scaffolding protein [Oscillospiraceae bacterium]